MLRRETIGDLYRLIERADDDDGAIAADRLARHRSRRQSSQLILDLLRYRAGQFLRWSKQNRARVSVVFRLRQHVRREMLWIALRRHDQNLCGPGDEVHPHFARQQLLGRRYVDVARAHDAIGFRDRGRAVRRRRDGLRAAHLKKIADSHQARRSQNLRHRPRASRADAPDACHLRRNRRHHEGRRQRILAAGNVRRYRIERPHNLAQAQTRCRFLRPLPRHLQFRERPNIRRSRLHRRAKLRRKFPTGRRQQTLRHANALAFEAVEFPRVGNQRLIPALPHRFQYRAHVRLGLVQSRRAPRQQPAHLSRLENSNHATSTYITILFNGYSTIPCPPACFRRGMISRTVDSSRMVFTASQSSSLRCEIVGRFNAGSTASTRSRQSRWTLSIKPTLPRALIAPSRSMHMSSSLRRFHASFQDSTLTMSCVFDSITVSMILRLLARSDEPVSVTSTMASASTGGFTSVAPQLNSTFAVTPCAAR